MRTRRSLLILSLVAALAAGAHAAPVWIEGESAELVSGPEIAPSGFRPGILSGEQWMTFAAPRDQAPAEGVTFGYTVDIADAGRYALWARVGFEWVRANLEVRFDGGEWLSMPCDDTTTNLVELGVWAEVAWDRGPDVTLSRGAHRLEARFTRPEANDRFLFGLDCLALVPEGTAWMPDNRLQPGESYDSADDRAAAATVHPIDLEADGRTRVPLDGLWQVARYDDPDMDADTYEPLRALPADADSAFAWRGISVPSDAWSARSELSFAHRLLYRTRIAVPAEAAGRSFLLHFGGHAWITSVFVNGQFVEGRQATIVPFDVDISRAVRPGETNTIDIVIKGSYYAMDHPEGQLDHNRNLPRTDDFLKYAKWIDCTWPTGKGGGESIKTGLTRSVELVVAGGVYTSDVFVRSSVREMRLDAEIELTNPGTGRAVTLEVEAVNAATGAVAKRFPAREVTVPTGARATVALSEPFAEAELWWPAESIDDKPTCYLLRCRLRADGMADDVHDTLFGFRELGVEGRNVTVNGVPWRPHAWNSLGYTTSPGPLEEYFRWNDRGVRMGGGVDVDVYDRNGIPGRLSMAWEGMFGQVAMNNPRMWENWKLHVEQMVRAYRNSPSVWHWSIGNEVMMITGRLFFGGEIGRHEKQLAEVFEVAHRLDPTRTVSEDGAGDAGGLGDSCDWHYVTGEYKIPREFYEYAIGPASTQREGIDFQAQYRWDGARPLVQGEEFYFAGMGNFAWFGGPKVYRGRDLYAAAGGRYGRMYTEGARWQDVFQVNPCQGPLPGVEKAMAGRAVFVREYNDAFAPSSEVIRTIKVFNDTRESRTLELRWSLELSGAIVESGTRTYDLAAGENREDRLTLHTPSGEGRGRLALELLDAGEVVFTDDKPFAVMPHMPPAGFAPGELAVFDPNGALIAWLASVGQGATVVADLGAIPASAKVLLVGNGALSDDSRPAAAEALRRFVSVGNTAIVLEQTSPLREGDLPVEGVVVADREKGAAARPEWERVGGHTGAIAHPMAPAHPVLAGLTPDDFFTWAGDDQIVYRLSHATPASGAIGLVQAGEDLSLAPLFELRAGRGSYLLCQLALGEKLGTEPVAARVLQNALAWAAARGSAKPAHTLLYDAGDGEFRQWVEGLGVVCAPARDLDALLADGVDIAVVRATPEALAGLAQRLDRVRTFTERGGWLMLAGVDEAGLASFQQLVGVDHRIRPFRKEGVLVAAPEDALAMGISDRDLLQYDPEVIAPWMGLHRISGKVFSSVVDASEEVASFTQLSAFAEGSDRPLTDGLTGETFWRYTQYVSSLGGEPVVLRLDRPEMLTSIDTWQSDAYFWAKDIEVSLDGQPLKTVTLKNATGWQTIDFPPTEAREVSLRLLDCYPATREIGQTLVTLDEVRIHRQLPRDFASRVVPISSPAGVVKYPIGKGGIVLNEVRFDGDDLPDNVAKKRSLFSALLRNLGCAYRD